MKSHLSPASSASSWNLGERSVARRQFIITFYIDKSIDTDSVPDLGVIRLLASPFVPTVTRHK